MSNEMKRNDQLNLKIVLSSIFVFVAMTRNFFVCLFLSKLKRKKERKKGEINSKKTQ